MGKKETLPAINQVFLSGEVIGDPETRKTGEGRYPILEFDAETPMRVGRDQRLEPVRWIGKCFGAAAEQVSGKLRKNLQVLVRGRLSGFVRPKGKKPHIPEVTVLQLWVLPDMNIIFEADLAESSPEQREDELAKDLQ